MCKLKGHTYKEIHSHRLTHTTSPPHTLTHPTQQPPTNIHIHVQTPPTPNK